MCVGTDVARVFVHLCLLFRRANGALERVSYTGTVVYMVCECNPIPTTAAGVHVGTREPEKTKTALIWRHSPQPEARKSTNFGMSAFRFGALANDALTPRCGLLLGGRGLAAVGHDDCGRPALEGAASTSEVSRRGAPLFCENALAQTAPWMLLWRHTSCLNAPIGAAHRRHACFVSAARWGCAEARQQPVVWPAGTSSVAEQGRARKWSRWQLVRDLAGFFDRVSYTSRIAVQDLYESHSGARVDFFGSYNSTAHGAQ